MSAENQIPLEIGHVLFIDIVGYSKLLINEQTEQLRKLHEIIRSTGQVRAAEAEGKLRRLPTGDGGALVFRNSPEAPVLCALEIGEKLKAHPELGVRMGIHSGPVNEVTDLNEQINMAGAGINIAQRVMDCGDAGHILLSKRVADDLEAYPQWRPFLHDVGEIVVKHDLRISIFNLYGNGLGNSSLPLKLQAAERDRVGLAGSGSWLKLALLLLAAGALLIPLAIFAPAILHSLHQPTQSTAQPNNKTAVVSVPDKSIAVLPFENLSDDKQNAYFADGVQDEILTNLARIADLKVISRTSVMQYKAGAPRAARQIGKELGAAHLLEGSVQRAAGKVRVNVQLIDARDDRHEWAQVYDRALDDVFAIQSEIAGAIADQLGAKLSPTEKRAIEQPPTRDLAAYELYLRALTLFADSTNQFRAAEKLPEAAHLLDEAVARDPTFLLAWCRLSRVHSLIYWQGHDHTPARLDLARVAAQNALTVDPDSGEAHLALADYYYHGFRDYSRAYNELEVAGRTLPNSAELFEYRGYIGRRQGRWQEATQSLERALELDPRNFFVLQQLALAYEAQRRYSDQAKAYTRALTIIPGDPATRIYRAEVDLAARADIRPFQQTLAELIAENPSVAPDVDDPRYALCERDLVAGERALKNYPKEGLVVNGVNYPAAYWEGVIARSFGNSERAIAAFTAARKEVGEIAAKQPDFAAALSLLGLIDAGLGKQEDALRESRRACELLPMSQDAIDGVALVVNLAQIYAWCGEKDLAIEQIAKVEAVPNYLSYGLLKLQPIWDSLRGDQRFEKLVSKAKQKEKL